MVGSRKIRGQRRLQKIPTQRGSRWLKTKRSTQKKSRRSPILLMMTLKSIRFAGRI
jgi:hypothetical protein